MSATNEERTLRIERRDDGAAIVWMDVPGETMNTLQAGFAEEFAYVLGQLEGDATVRALVFASAKKGSFIAGANVEMIDAVHSADDASALSRAGQHAMDRLAEFPKPIVAAIDGPALGGGLEVALACQGRVASDNPKTKLGLPECQLGLLPGAGGTQRLPRLIGVQAALDLMLTGKQIDARKALKLDLVDDVVPAAILVDVAAELALKLATPQEEPSFLDKWADRLGDTDALTEAALTKTGVGRRVLFDQARKKLLEKTKGNYPAQERILDVVKVGLERGFKAGLEAEANAFGELVVSPESRNLRSIFFATTAMKKDNGTDDASVKPRPIRRVGMLGAGLMGAGIAYVTSTVAKTPVRLKDRDSEGVLSGLRYVRELLDGRVERKKMTRMKADRLMLEVSGTTSFDGFEDCDVVVEAVFEDLALKQSMLREVESRCSPETIFASNTSSLPIAAIAQASERPQNVLGMHYFSPVHKMPLLEIVVHEGTSNEATATCVELGKKQGKTVIVVNDGPGFYTTRILAPYMNEAAHLLAEGVPIERIDQALLSFGFPVGPMKLTDEVGIDVGAKVGGVMVEAFGARMTPPEGMAKLIADDRKGRKNGRGFYRYDGEKGVDMTVYETLGVRPTNTSVSDEEIAWRCTLAMVNEACLCFQEGILRSARDGDIGAIFGLGFPPFRGGPFRFVDGHGAGEIVRRLSALDERIGPRFAPAPLLLTMASEQMTFHGDRPAQPGRVVRATS